MTSKEKLIADLKIKLESAQSDLEEICVRKTALLTCMKALRSNLAPEEGLLYVPGFAKQPCIKFEYTIKKNLGKEFRKFFHLQQKLNRRICDLETPTEGFIILTVDQELSAQTIYVPKYIEELHIEPKEDTFVDVVCKDSKHVYRFGYNEKDHTWGVLYEVNYEDFIIANVIDLTKELSTPRKMK